MIYLIGGSPRCGKTTVARKLATKSHIPWFPADYLGAVVLQYISPGECTLKFPLRTIHDQDPSNDFLYANYSPEEIVGFYKTQAEATWQGLKAFIEYAATDEQDFILEGYQIRPELLSELGTEIKEKTRPTFLYKTNVAEIEAGFKKNISPGDWLMTKTKEESTFNKVASMVALYGEKTKSEAEKYAMPVFNMDENFEEKVKRVVDSLIP